MRDRVVSGILFGNTHSTIPIQVEQSSIRKTGRTTYTVAIEIKIPVAQLTALLGPNGYEGAFKVLTVAANPDGNISEIAEKEQAFRYPEWQLSKARSGNYVYSLDIEVRDTSDRALIAVVDALDGDTGYAEIALEPTNVTKAQRPVVSPTGPIETRGPRRP